MLFSTSLLSEIFEEPHHQDFDRVDIYGVSTDTRKDMKGNLFIPLKGESFDAHDFLESAMEQGAVAALWEKKKPLPNSVKEGFPLFFVEDTLSALQLLAEKYLRQVDPVVIGVTGSNGKTTTKDLISAVCSTVFKTHKTAGNFNNHIGLPLTILSMPKDTEVIVLEMGMNQFGEIELLSKLAKPDYGVITNIGESHIENLGSRAGIAKAKSEILAGMKEEAVLIFDGDEPLLNEYKKRKNSVSCGYKEGNLILIKEFEMHDSFSTFSVNGEIDFELGMLGRHNAKNACFAISIAQQLKVPEENIKKALKKVQLTGMRFEILEGKNGTTIVNDAYNASPTSMKASIEVIREMSPYRKKVLVLGDIFELGKDAEELHKTIAEAITPEIDALFTIGSYTEVITKEVLEKNKKTTAVHLDSFSSLAEQLQAYLEPENLVFLKASRGMKLEQILKDLQ